MTCLTRIGAALVLLALLTACGADGPPERPEPRPGAQGAASLAAASALPRA